MDRSQNLWRNLGLRPPSEAIRSELLVLQHAHFSKNLPFLYLTLLFGVVSGAIAFSPETSVIFRIVLPIVVGAACCFRMAWWFLHRSDPADAASMAKLIPRTTVVSAIIGTICGLWGAFGWYQETSIFRYYIPAFMALGAFSTAYCISTMPRTAIYAVLSGVMPISFILITSGTMIDTALGATIVASTIFLIGLILRQYSQWVQMIELKRQMDRMAHTDSLTSLLNRRAFHKKLEQVAEDERPEKDISIAMIDLDDFKGVNDHYGHQVGDVLLIEIARRMEEHVGDLGAIARLGGDEFAILFIDTPPIFCLQTMQALVTKLAKPITIQTANIPVGISFGLESFDQNERLSSLELMARADKKLYAMKAVHAAASAEQVPSESEPSPTRSAA